MNPGDTFTLADRSVDSHLWIVVSDPAIDPERVLFVSMTSYDITKEKVCLLDVGDSPFHQASDLHRLRFRQAGSADDPDRAARSGDCSR